MVAFSVACRRRRCASAVRWPPPPGHYAAPRRRALPYRPSCVTYVPWLPAPTPLARGQGFTEANAVTLSSGHAAEQIGIVGPAVHPVASAAAGSVLPQPRGWLGSWPWQLDYPHIARIFAARSTFASNVESR